MTRYGIAKWGSIAEGGGTRAYYTGYGSDAQDGSGMRWLFIWVGSPGEYQHKVEGLETRKPNTNWDISKVAPSLSEINNIKLGFV